MNEESLVRKVHVAGKNSDFLSPEEFSDAGSLSQERGEAKCSSQCSIVTESWRFVRDKVSGGHIEEVR